MLKAREIPDSCVTLPIANDKPALVTSMNNATKLYYAYSLECEWSCCDCMWALKGNICKHQIKSSYYSIPTLQKEQLHIIMDPL